MSNQEPEYFSQEGIKKITAELEDLRTKKRREIADRLEYAKNLGDLSENSEYQEAKESQMLNETRIAELEDVLRRAVLVSKEHSRETVEIGSTVVIEDARKTRSTFTIVGSQEAAPQENKISNESPVARALLGNKKFSEVQVQTPKGIMEYTIVDIS